MLEREAMGQLEEWKSSGDSRRKALLVSGARQTGKTTLVREFARRNYECFAELNFLEDPTAKAIFDGPLDADTIVRGLTAYLRQPLVPGRTLVLLDEVQECPNARTAVKFLVEDGRFDYVETGSLLGVRTRQVRSYPVGYERELRMFPLTLREFCVANGVQRSTLDALAERFERREPVDEAVNQTMLRLAYAYLVIGGMPEVVDRYVRTHDVAQAMQLQRDLLRLYRLDIQKYAGGSDMPKIRQIFDSIPSQLDERNRRFVLADLDKGARRNRYESSFLWLADAGVALPCYNVSAPVVPLEANDKKSLFKLFMGDVGLLCAASMENVQFDLLRGDIDVNLGSVAENFVAQELLANGFALHYFHSNRLGEVDFVVQDGSRVLPVEVKSGGSWRAHRALDNVMGTRDWGLEEAFVLCKGNVGREGRTTYLPLYMTMFMRPQGPPRRMEYAVDLGPLGA